MRNVRWGELLHQAFQELSLVCPRHRDKCRRGGCETESFLSANVVHYAFEVSCGCHIAIHKVLVGVAAFVAIPRIGQRAFQNYLIAIHRKHQFCLMGNLGYDVVVFVECLDVKCIAFEVCPEKNIGKGI